MKFDTFSVGTDDLQGECIVCSKVIRPGQETSRFRVEESDILVCCPFCLSAYEEQPQFFLALREERMSDYATLHEIPFRSKEVSWLSFNQRVLQEAENRDLPAVERMRYLGIYSSNLDEFFRVRVATLKRLCILPASQIPELQIPNPKATLKIVTEILGKETQRFDDAYAAVLKDLKNKYDVRVVSESEVPPELKEFVQRYFSEMVRPHLMPIMLKGRQRLAGLQDQPMYLAVRLSRSNGKGRPAHALLEIPTRNLPRFAVLPELDGIRRVMFLDDIIRYGLADILATLSYDCIESFAVKFTRDAEMEFDDDITESVFAKVAEGIRARVKGSPVRINHDRTIPGSFLKLILKKLAISPSDTYPGARYHNRKDLMGFPDFGDAALKFPPFRPVRHPAIKGKAKLLKLIRARDILLHFPYQPFSHFIDLLREAALDPLVVSIQITQYRAAEHSAVAKALICAVRNGKEVTIVVEPRARFDERANIGWANEFQEAGVHVILGVPSLKVHSKICLITRREHGKQRWYTAIGTGNFNEDTAQLYTDHLLLTYDQQIGHDAARIFRYFRSPVKAPRLQHLLMAPYALRQSITQLVEHEIRAAKDGKEAEILIKLNNLSDVEIVRLLYRAARKGVRVRLIIRSMFSVVTGTKGFGDKIKAIGIVDRFLEHTRILYFANGGYFISSADFLPRNFDSRVETVCPIYDESLQEQLHEYLRCQWKDGIKARVLDKELRNKFRKAKAGSESDGSAQETIAHWLGTAEL